MKYKTIRVKETTYNALTELGKKGDSFDDIINQILPKTATVLEVDEKNKLIKVKMVKTGEIKTVPWKDIKEV